MKHRRVLLDASVLYTEPVRGVLLWVAGSDAAMALRQGLPKR